MLHMLVRNRVADFSEWKRIFHFHAEAHSEAGLRLIHLWQSIEDERLNDGIATNDTEDCSGTGQSDCSIC